jgi:hypothetical protein
LAAEVAWWSLGKPVEGRMALTRAPSSNALFEKNIIICVKVSIDQPFHRPFCRFVPLSWLNSEARWCGNPATSATPSKNHTPGNKTPETQAQDITSSQLLNQLLPASCPKPANPKSRAP